MWFGLFLFFHNAVNYVRKLRKISKSSNDLSALNDEERRELNEIMGD